MMLKRLIACFMKLLRNRKVGREKIEQKIIVVGDVTIINHK